jgi:hypothetical protein
MIQQWASLATQLLNFPRHLSQHTGGFVIARGKQYSALLNLTSVREHLVWDDDNPLKRFAKRPDLLTDSTWRESLALLDKHDFKCGLEIFAHQLPDLTRVI